MSGKGGRGVGGFSLVKVFDELADEFSGVDAIELARLNYRKEYGHGFGPSF